MSWFSKLFPAKIKTLAKKDIAPVWETCPSCNAYLFRAELERNYFICPKCEHHFRIPARTRLKLFLDADSQEEIAASLKPIDHLKFKDSKKYKDRLMSAQQATGENDALVAVKGTLQNQPIVAMCFEFDFIGGSMGAIVGQKFIEGANVALKDYLPLICFSCSGGARMQEGLFSLIQMARTSAILTKLKEHGLPFISIMVDPCMGGVSASFAMLGDLNIAEPKALIGFAGPRVIEQTVRQSLPEGFQKSEFVLAKGFIDLIVNRKHLASTVSQLLSQLCYYRKTN